MPTIKKTQNGIEYLFTALKEKAQTITRAVFWKIPHHTPQEDIALKIGRYNKANFSPETLEVENPKSALTYLGLIILNDEAFFIEKSRFDKISKRLLLILLLVISVMY